MSSESDPPTPGISSGEDLSQKGVRELEFLSLQSPHEVSKEKLPTFVLRVLMAIKRKLLEKTEITLEDFCHVNGGDITLKYIYLFLKYGLREVRRKNLNDSLIVALNDFNYSMEEVNDILKNNNNDWKLALKYIVLEILSR